MRILFSFYFFCPFFLFSSMSGIIFQRFPTHPNNNISHSQTLPTVSLTSIHHNWVAGFPPYCPQYGHRTSLLIQYVNSSQLSLSDFTCNSEAYLSHPGNVPSMLVWVVCKIAMVTQTEDVQFYQCTGKPTPPQKYMKELSGRANTHQNNMDGLGEPNPTQKVSSKTGLGPTKSKSDISTTKRREKA